MKGLKIGLAAIFVMFLSLAMLSPLYGSETALTVQDLIENAKKSIKTITATEADEMYENGGILILDVREPKEYKSGHIPGAVNVPRGLLEMEIGRKAANRDATILVYCRSGARSALATSTLMQMGYNNAVNMDGGWNAWLGAGYPVE